MTYDLEEQEQIDALKAWWTKYGNLILSVLIVIMLAVVSWQGWNWYQRSQASQAAGYFEALQNAARQGNAAQVGSASQALKEDFSSTAYAPRGALLAAQAFVASGDAERARAELEWIISEHADDPLAPVARVRLAGILMDLEQFDAALKAVGEPAPAGFEGLYADRRGDVLHAQGKKDEALLAWQQALEAFGTRNPALRSVVQLKIDALGGASA